MSVRVMSAVWEAALPPMEKLVLLALADAANDEGHCWPSATTVCKKSGQGERTVRRCIQALCEKGHLTQRQRPGTSAVYTVHPCQSGTPARAAPLPDRPVTPARAAPKPLRTIKSSEAKASSPRGPFPKPEGVDAQVWRDFLANRQRKRLPNTSTAHKRLMDDLRRLSDAEWSIPRLLENAAARGWAGIYDPRDEVKARKASADPPSFVETYRAERQRIAAGSQ